MKLVLKTSFSVICLLAASSTSAAEFEDYARVVRVSPQVERINQPRQECKTEYVQVQQQQQQERGMTGSIVGGLAGGLIGSQVGGGRGRTAATAAGAVAGAIIGDRVQNSGNSDNVVTTEQPVRQCHTVDHWETRTTGYQVTYQYHGHTYSTVMPDAPGKRIKLHVALTPQ
jgi:uncharacterized protein YcfJ